MQLFISYVQSDYSTAQTIADILRFSGHVLWFEHRLFQGSDWQITSCAAIEWCDVLVILLSPKSVESSWCTWEWTEALDTGKPAVPVLIEPCHVPAMFQNLEYIDLCDGNTLVAVAQLLGGLHAPHQTGNNNADHQPEPAQITRFSQVSATPTWSPSKQSINEFEENDLLTEPENATLLDEPVEGKDAAADSGFEYDEDIVTDAFPVLDADPIFGHDPQFELPEPEPPSLVELPAQVPLPPTLPEIDAFKEADYGEADTYEFPYEPETVLIPTGTFAMGCEMDEGSLVSDTETPQHTVMVSEFRIGKYPVTIGEFWAFIDEGGYFEQRFWTHAGWTWREEHAISQPRFWDDDKWSGNHRLPVIGVSWYEAVAYTQWLSEITGRLYRLPTESEWEFAARGTDGRMYPWGNTWYPGLCNVVGAGVWRTTAVGYYSPGGDSPYGIADMCGNVWEWCLTKWRDRYTEPEDNIFSGNATRCLRGGSWFSHRQDARVTARIPDEPGDWDDHLGFRVACGPPPQLDRSDIPGSH